MTETILTRRWHGMLMHAERRRFLESPARHRLAAAGRRSGKTEDAKRLILKGDANHGGALNPPDVPRPRYVVAGPTRDQLKRVWWQDLKDLSPPWAVTALSESELWIRYVTGAEVWLIGLDKPQRGEGDPIDGLVIDETQEIKAEAFSSSLRPALSNRGRPPGWSLRIGRPRGRNHFYQWWHDALTLEDHAAFTWKSDVILPATEIEAARRDLDPLTFAQEYEAAWINFEGRAYYQWNPADHYKTLDYREHLPLIFCFDFNVDPGVAAVLQEQDHPREWPECPGCKRLRPGRTGERCATCGLTLPTITMTCAIGEVHRRDTNTPEVCNHLAQDWGRHKGPVMIYGDPSGGARKSSQTEGADWDQVRNYLKPHFPDMRWRVARAAPPERDRINVVNTRLRSADGTVRFAVDPRRCQHIVMDFEGVTLVVGGTGEIDKRKKSSPGTASLTHLSDAIGYYMHETFPIGGTTMRVQ